MHDDLIILRVPRALILRDTAGEVALFTAIQAALGDAPADGPTLIDLGAPGEPVLELRVRRADWRAGDPADVARPLMEAMRRRRRGCLSELRAPRRRPTWCADKRAALPF